MPRPSKEELQKFWDFADKNNDGKLSIHEFKAAVVEYSKRSGCQAPSDRDIANLFTSLNDDKDSFLSKEEYYQHIDKEELNKQKMEEAFKAFDKDGDGTISRAELVQMMQGCGYKPKDVDIIMKQCDADGDGKISFNEFINALA